MAIQRTLLDGDTGAKFSSLELLAGAALNSQSANQSEYSYANFIVGEAASGWVDAVAEVPAFINAVNKAFNIVEAFWPTGFAVPGGLAIQDAWISDSATGEVTVRFAGNSWAGGTVTLGLVAYYTATPTPTPPPPNTPVTINTATTSLAWWRSDLGITPAAGKVPAWTDQVHSYVVSQGTGAAQPVYNASDAAFGGNPSVQADGATQWLEQTGGLATVLSGDDTPWELWIVLRAATVTADGVFTALCNTAATNTHLSFIQNTTKWAQVRGAAALVNGGTPVVNTTYLVRILFSGTQVTIIANGVTVVPATPLDAAAQVFDRFALFAQRQAAGGPLSMFNGKIAEVYYCGFGTTAPVRANLVTYFQNRYPGVS